MNPSKKKFILTEGNIEKSMIYLDPQTYTNIVGDSNITSEELTSILSNLANKNRKSDLQQEVSIGSMGLDNSQRGLPKPNTDKLRHDSEKQLPNRKEVYQLMPSEEDKESQSMNQNEDRKHSPYTFNIYDLPRDNKDKEDYLSGYDTTAKLKGAGTLSGNTYKSKFEITRKELGSLSMPDINMFSSEDAIEQFNIIPVLPSNQFISSERTITNDECIRKSLNKTDAETSKEENK